MEDMMALRYQSRDHYRFNLLPYNDSEMIDHIQITNAVMPGNFTKALAGKQREPLSIDWRETRRTEWVEGRRSFALSPSEFQCYS